MADNEDWSAFSPTAEIPVPPGSPPPPTSVMTPVLPRNAESDVPRPPSEADEYAKYNPVARPYREPEMRAYHPGPTEWVTNKAQDALMALGMKPYDAKHFATAGTNIASTLTPAGPVLSGAEAVSDLSKGHYGSAALNTVGALPLAKYGRQVYRTGAEGRQIFPGFVDDTNAKVFGGRRPEAPSSTALLDSGASHMDDYAQSGKIYPKSFGSDTVSDARVALRTGGHGQTLNPATHEAIDQLAQTSRNSPLVTAQDMNELRLQLSQSIKAGEPGGHAARSALFNKLENTGDTSLAKGVGDYAAGSRGQTVDDILAASQRRDDPSKALEGKLRSAVESERKLRGFNDAEVTALDNARRGPITARILENSGNALTGKGLTGAVQRIAPSGALGAGIGGWLGRNISPVLGATLGTAAGTALPTAAGTALKAAAAPIRREAAEAAGDLVRQRSPLYRDIVAADAAAPYRQTSPGQSFLLRNAITQELLRRPESLPEDNRIEVRAGSRRR